MVRRYRVVTVIVLLALAVGVLWWMPRWRYAAWEWLTNRQFRSEHSKAYRAEIYAYLDSGREPHAVEKAIWDLIGYKRSTYRYGPFQWPGPVRVKDYHADPDPERRLVLLDLIEDYDPNIRSYAACFLGDSEEEVAAMVRLLDDEDELVRPNVILTVGRAGPKARAAAPVLARRAQETDMDYHPHAALALWQITGECDVSVPVLAAALEDDRLAIRQVAADALLSMNDDACGAFPQLCHAALHDSDRLVRMYCVGALADCGERAVPTLIKALQDSDRVVCSWAITSLGRVGPQAGAAVPHLETLLQAPEAYLREEAAEALKKITPASKVQGQ
jgi:HEAT repeat protein